MKPAIAFKQLAIKETNPNDKFPTANEDIRNLLMGTVGQYNAVEIKESIV